MELKKRISPAAPSRCRVWVPGLFALAALFVVLLASPGAVEAQGLHGIGFAKGCQSPVKVGDPYTCGFIVANNGDTGTGAVADTVVVTSLVDTVCTATAPPACGGAVSSGNVIGSISKDFDDVGNGTSSCLTDPMTTVTTCTLPPGSAIVFGGNVVMGVPTFNFTHHTVQPGNLDPLPDNAVIVWRDLCDSLANNCPVGTQTADAGSQATLTCPTCTDGVCFNEACNETTNACVRTNETTAVSCELGTPDPNACTEEQCDGLGNCVENIAEPSVLAAACDTTRTCGSAVCDPADGSCDQTCILDTAANRANPLFSGCFVTVSDCIWENVDDACQGPDTCPGAGVDGVTVSLSRCVGGLPVSTLESDVTSGGGLYSISELSIGADCEPVDAEWAIDVDTSGFIAANDLACTDDNDDSDCDSTGFTGCGGADAVIAGGGDVVTSLDCGVEDPDCTCLLIIDEEGLDNDFKTVERFASTHSTLPSYLINDDCQDNGQVCPTGFGDGEVPNEQGNPWLLWNIIGEGDIAKLPTGQDDDEGWYMLPPENQLPWTYQEFVDGLIPQSELDKIPNVMPLRNQDIESLVGRTCLAIVYDSDISINYKPLNANLQGERYGKFAFTLLAVETPGSVNGDPYPQVLPESKSSTSLYDVWIRVEADEDPACLEAGLVDIHDHEPDACEIKKAVWNGAGLSILGESDRGGTNGTTTHKAFMTFSIDNTDIGALFNVDPIFLEQPMSLVPGTKRYRFISAIFPAGHPNAGAAIPNLVGRRISIQTDEGCTYNGRVRSR